MNLKILVSVIVIGTVISVLLVLFTDESILINASESNSVNFDNAELTILETNGVKHIIPLDKIKGSGPPKDGIPSIDNPVFADVQNSHFMSDSDTVIGLEINGEAKAYLLFILVWHEIVNDDVGGIPVSVTYCPLCYTN